MLSLPHFVDLAVTSSHAELNIVLLAAPRQQTSSDAAGLASMVLVMAIITISKPIRSLSQHYVWGSGRALQQRPSQRIDSRNSIPKIVTF